MRLRAAAILPVFALKKNFEFGWKPPVHILDNNAVSVGTTPQPAGLEASKGVISVNYSNGPLDPSWQDTPRHEEVFRLHGEVLCRRRQSLRSGKFGDFQTDAQPTGAGLQETSHSPPNQRNVVPSWQAFPSTDNFCAQCW
jgi:hypothetical protein